MRHKRTCSRGQTRANSTLDIDWSGNTRDINHLVRGRKGLDRDTVNFETSCRQYVCKTNFNASKPWSYLGSEKIEDRSLEVKERDDGKNNDLLLSKNERFMSVNVAGLKNQGKDRLLDHLYKPKFDDTFISKGNASSDLYNTLQKESVGSGLSEIQWMT